MSVNIWQKFQGLIAKTPLMIVTVTALNGDGTCTVSTFDGAEFKVIGQTVPVGQTAYIRGGQIMGGAPNLTLRAEQTI